MFPIVGRPVLSVPARHRLVLHQHPPLSLPHLRTCLNLYFKKALRYNAAMAGAKLWCRAAKDKAIARGETIEEQVITVRGIGMVVVTVEDAARGRCQRCIQCELPDKLVLELLSCAVDCSSGVLEDELRVAID